MSLHNRADLGLNGSAPSLSPLRKFVIGLTLAATVGANFAAIALHIDSWPISRYSMYAGIAPKTQAWAELYGVTGDGEIRLPADVYFPPFKAPGLTGTLQRLPPDQLAPFLVKLGARYEEARIAGRHKAPPIRELIAYQLSIPLDPDLGTRAEPIKRRVLARVSLSEGMKGNL